MPVEFYIAIGALCLVVVAFVWLRSAAKTRSNDPRIGENRESGWNGFDADL
jgi:hypothetical protein